MKNAVRRTRVITTPRGAEGAGGARSRRTAGGLPLSRPVAERRPNALSARWLSSHMTRADLRAARGVVPEIPDALRDSVGARSSRCGPPNAMRRQRGTQFAPGAAMKILRAVVRVGGVLLLLGLMASPLRSQVAPGSAPPPTAPAPREDLLGRDTPRGTVRGFLRAARRAEDDLARQYLDTPLNAGAAATLARQLFVVLDTRLPARLAEVSDLPEGSRANPLRPDQELVGTIPGAEGDVEVLVERVTRGGEQVWLFGQATLRAVPSLHAEITLGWGDGALPRFLTGTRLGGIRLFEWMAALLGLPMFYLLTLLLNRLLTPLIRAVSRRFLHSTTVFNRQVLPTPVRILILAFATRWFGASLPLPLLVRQFWSNLASLLTIVGLVWLAILVNGEVEQYIRRRIAPASLSAGTSLARLLRRLLDLVALLAGLLGLLRHFGLDPTPALAGLGVGGIAVALAAQKTLENVVAGASLIFDQAVQVGDFLKVGELSGTVDQIGLRSTRIRTLDRTVVSIPNSQIANVTLETLSARDRFWFHPVVGVRYETTPEQLRAVLDGFRRLLVEHPAVDDESVRVRFLRLGAFSLDIDVFVYIEARDWNHFLEVQEQLLFGVTRAVAEAGAEIALPSQTMYLAGSRTRVTVPELRQENHM
jgi:MscS family membrane protein